MNSDKVDLTPNPTGIMAWAKKVLAEAPPESNDARVARAALAECGVTDEGLSR